MKKIVSFFFLILFPLVNFAGGNESEFQKIFSEWTNAFNQKNLTTSCELFSPHVTADYQGFPQKNYDIICGGFKKIFQEKNRQYKYDFKLHHVYRESNLAAARITWYLTIYENGKPISVTKDQGLDVFQKDKNGNWKIINYLGYPDLS